MVISHGGAIYAEARERGWNWRDVLDFSASINPLGPAPGVRDAILGAIDEIVHYPDPYAARLVRALAEEWNVEPESILPGNGATDLIHFFASAWRERHVTLVVPTFSEFHRAWPDAATVGLREQWPEDGLLVVTNPNNPTGQWTAPPDRRGLTLVDESFLEFTEGGPTCLHRGMLVLRSLTKFQALPGLRVGALVGPPDVMIPLRERRAPWQVNVLAEAAALASLAGRDHAARTRAYIAAERDRMLEAVRKLPGVHPLPSAANYLFAGLEYSAGALCSHLLAHRILIRNCTGMPGVTGNAVRFAIRTREENAKLLSAWRDFRCA